MFKVKYMKYFIDVVLLFFALPLFLFFYPIISLLILIFDGTPILYSQLRVGLYGNEFKLYKFRTMSILSDDSVHQNHYENLSENKKIEPSLTPDNPIRIENDDRIVDSMWHSAKGSRSEHTSTRVCTRTRGRESVYCGYHIKCYSRIKVMGALQGAL